MTVVFCTTCKGRTQHLEKTLPKNMHDNPNAKFVLVDYSSQDHLQDWLRENQPHWEDQLTVYSFRGELLHGWKRVGFHMAHAKNMAHRCALLEGADVLVNLDADNFAGAGFSDYAAYQFLIEPLSFLWSRMIKDGEGRLPKGISGRIAVSKHAFLNAGGYDERFDTWGPDDKDFTARLGRLGYSAREIDPYYLQAIMHNDKLRFREYRHAAISAGEDEMEVLDSDATVVNFGNIGCGTVYRNFDFSTPIELKPLPTRIFGIGLHKTATTSLHKALTILGYDSAHWKSAHWAKAIWREMTARVPCLECGGEDPKGEQEGNYFCGMCGGEGTVLGSLPRSITLERSYALCDLPIPLLYRELDAAYPGSKFILTVRDEEKWLRSVRNHWDGNLNPFRRQWKDDPFTNKVHRLLYGQNWFDAEIFLNRYRRHNAEVREYFKDRPGDLLEMWMGDDHLHWISLCSFLDVPIPDVPYPMEFRTKDGLLSNPLRLGA